MEESKKVNTEHFKKKIGNTTYRVKIAFSAEYQADFYGQREYADYE